MTGRANLTRLPDEVVERALRSEQPGLWARGYRAGRRANHRTDTDGYLRRYVRPQDAPRIAGYLTGLAATRAASPQGIAEMHKWQRRDVGPGQPPKRREVLPELREAVA